MILKTGVLWGSDGVNVRMVMDYSKINKFVKRPVHLFPSVADIVRSILAGTHFFAKMDAIHGYFQLALDEESTKLMTFLLGKCQNWKVSESIFCPFWKKLESVRIGKYQNWKVSESESVRIEKCQNWKVSELESV